MAGPTTYSSYTKWGTASLVALFGVIGVIIAGRGVSTGYVPQSRLDQAQARIAQLEQAVAALTAQSPAAYARGGVAVWMRFHSEAGYDPNDPASVQANFCTTVDRAAAMGLTAIVGWDCATVGTTSGTYIGYVGDTDLSNIPDATWRACFAYARSKGVIPGIELTGGKALGGWYASDSECIAATLDTVRRHEAKGGGGGYFYWDSNGGAGDRTKEQQVAVIRAVAAGAPRSRILCEWSADGWAGEFAAVADLYIDFGNGSPDWRWPENVPEPTGRLVCSVAGWRRFSPTEQAKALPTLRRWLAAGRAVPLVEAWYDAVPGEWK